MLPKEYIPRYTIEDYKQWQGDWELIEGIPFAITPSPFGKHQKIISKLSYLLLAENENCSHNNIHVYVELDWIVNEETIVRPDISILCKDIPEYIKTPPEVIFEVVSKSTTLRDEKIKFDLYKEEGVKIYILVYPDIKKVRAFKLKEKSYEKFFDGDTGALELEICNCKIKLDIEKIFD